MMFVVDNTPTQIALLFCFNDVFYERGLCNVSMSAWLSYHNKSLLDASNLDWIIALAYFESIRFISACSGNLYPHLIYIPKTL